MGKFEDLARSEIVAGDSIWEEIPVSQEVFFKDWIREPMYPIQQEAADATLGTNSIEWGTEYDEVQALWGKGSGKDRSSAKMSAYVCYKLMCMRDPVGYLSSGG